MTELSDVHFLVANNLKISTLCLCIRSKYHGWMNSSGDSTAECSS